MQKNKLRILSLGAGVQSTTLALMVKHGDLPMVDCAIFADTGWEPKAVYAHLDWLESVLPFPVVRVSNGNIREETLAAMTGTGKVSVGKTFAPVPWFTLSAKGKAGMGRRECTFHYKMKPLRRKAVEMMGGRPKGGCTMLIGISQDEGWRMKQSRVQYIVNNYPLIEKGMTRQDCLRWLEERQYRRPPKSSCIGCPFHSNDQWRALTPDELTDAVEVDRAIRDQAGKSIRQFMHAKRIPLEEVDLSTAEDRGQLNLFLNECEGMCGV